MAKNYSPQCGPNLVFYDCSNEPDNAVLHKGCGGMFVQNLGPSSPRSHDKPDNSPGKVYCYECGHKAGKSVSAALKIGTNREHFYFPGKNEYDIYSRTFLDKNAVLRYWEWQLKGQPGLSEAAARELRHLKARKQRKVKQLVPKIVITREEDDWIVTHPRITLRLPVDEFSAVDVRKVEVAWRSSANINKTTEELEEIANEVLNIGFVAILNHENFFGVVEGTTVIIMHRPAWDAELVGIFANNIKGVPADQIENCASIFAQAHGKSPGSFAVERDYLEKMKDELPAGEEDIDF